MRSHTKISLYKVTITIIAPIAFKHCLHNLLHKRLWINVYLYISEESVIIQKYVIEVALKF